MDECINSLTDAQIFVGINADSGYRQMVVDPSVRDKIALTSQHVLYQLTRMLFGSKNSQSPFSKS